MRRCMTGKAAITLVVFLGVFAQRTILAPAAEPPIKNVIVMIADGCSADQYTLLRWFRQHKPLALDGIRTGAMQTYIADSVIADSAPAATAFATGYRTSDKLIGVGPKPCTLTIVPPPPAELQYRPLATVLEGARLLGKSTGIVATSRVTHATPAAYMAHVPSRKLEEDIMEQAVYQGVDVVFGGGKDYLLPRGKGGKRPDGEDLLEVLTGHGYQFIETRQALAGLKSGKVFGLFAMGPMAPELDRPHLRSDEPTLAEMTAKAIELLSANRQGFFLMVEGSQIDWACHANDPAHLLSDLGAYDDAVRVALDFARQDRQTLVLAFSDHNTGGMSIGNARSNKTYSQLSVEALVCPLREMNLSAPGMWKKLCDGRDPAAVKPETIAPQAVIGVVKEHWGVELNLKEAQQILAIAGAHPEDPQNGFGEVVCPTRTFIGWTSHGHVGGDVPLFAFGPGRPVGLVDGPEIGRITARALGLDLERLNARLFAEARAALAPAEVTVDETDVANPRVIVRREGKTYELPVNKNLLQTADKQIALEGPVVYAPKTCKVYLPLQAVNLILERNVALPKVGI